MKALSKGTKRLAAEEPQPFTEHDEASSIDGVISTCYRLVGSFEEEIRIDQVTRCVSRGNLARTLGEIADKAFALAWNTRDLTCIQQAQILDILLSVASLQGMPFTIIFTRERSMSDPLATYLHDYLAGSARRRRSCAC